MRSHPATPTTLARRCAGDGPTVVLVHGFAQTGGCLGPLADDLATDHHVVLPDAPGHGGSDVHRRATVADAAALLASTAGAPAVWVGYSMGGRMCLRLAVDRPDLVRGLVLVGATAGIDDPAGRAARRRSDEDLARHLEEVGVRAFLDEWLALPLFAGLPPWARFEDERRSNSVAGLAEHLRRAGTGAMEPLWDRLDEVGASGARVRCVAGGRDAKFAALAERLADGIGGDARAVRVPGAGHAAHLESPEAVTAVVRDVLRTAHP